jgi:hypothetical protein
MFDSLDEQMERDEKAETTPKERMTHYALIGVAAVVVFGGLMVAIYSFGG